MAITQQQIANRLGVSQRTVAFAFDPNSRISDKTRKRVVEMANEMGYRRNASAAAMRSGSFNTVAMIYRADTAFSPLEFIKGVGAELEKSHVRLNMTRMTLEEISAGAWNPALLRELSADGIIVDYSQHIPAETISLLQRTGIPVVWFNTNAETDCVYPDDIAIMRRATELVIGRGHRKVEFVSYSSLCDPNHLPDHYSKSQREKGYRAAMQEAGLVPSITRRPQNLYLPGGRIEPGRVEEAVSILCQESRPTAVVCDSRFVAESMVIAALKLGIDVPRELSVVTVDRNVHKTFPVDISSILLPYYSCGVICVKKILSKIKDKTAFSSIPVDSAELLGATYSDPLSI